MKEDMSKYMDAFNEMHDTDRFQKAFAKQEKLRMRREKEMRSQLLEKQTRKIIESGERTPSQPNNSPVDETEGFPFGGRTAAGAKNQNGSSFKSKSIVHFGIVWLHTLKK